MPVDRANAIVVGVSDDDPPSGIDGEAHRPIELRVENDAVAITGDVTTGDRRHHARRGHATNRIVPGVSHVDRRVWTDGKARRCVEPGGWSRTVGIDGGAAREGRRGPLYTYAEKYLGRSP